MCVQCRPKVGGPVFILELAYRVTMAPAVRRWQWRKSSTFEILTKIGISISLCNSFALFGWRVIDISCQRYRAIERYSARRASSSSIPSAFDSNVASISDQTRRIVWRAASLYSSKFQSILGRRSSDFSLAGSKLRSFWTNLFLVLYVTCYLVPYILITEGFQDITTHLKNRYT